MVLRRLLLLVPALLAVALVPALPAVGAGTPPKKYVKVGDDFFGPTKLNVKRGTTVVWKWQGGTRDTHDVALRSGPKKVKRFRSDSAAVSGFSFKKKLTRPGTYRIYCTFHAVLMRQTIVVR